MLIALKIQNFALIDSLELELQAGLNVLTGETGAGKSIVLDAIDAVLGGKVPGRVVRSGQDRAVIEATFSLSPDLQVWLKQQGIRSLDPSRLFCSREIGANNGRGRARVNGIVVNRRQTEELRDRLVEITAQGQTMQLGQTNLQRGWLDNFGGAKLLQQREQVAQLHGVCQEALRTLERRRNAESQRLQQMDVFEYQSQELRGANLQDPNELDDLQQEVQRLSHGVELQHQSYQVYQALYQNDQGGSACADLLGTAEQTLGEMVEYDAQVQPILDLVSHALAQVEEAGRQMSAYGDGVETDPERLAEAEARIAELKVIVRKYGPTLGDAIERYQQIQAELDLLTGGDQSLEALEEAHAKAQDQLNQACGKLTKLRRKAAQTLETRLVAELKPLAMDKVQFQVDITEILPQATGADQITFLFSPNPGEPLQPLGEIASGGEMSRFLLALKACFSQVDRVETMIFDEIDVGVSGRVSQAIAEKLHQLSQDHQLLCVTHQPLIAAMADRHFRVRKEVLDQDRTVIHVETLGDQAARTRELAELAGGESAQEALSFAQSLLSQAADRRQGHGAPASGHSSSGHSETHAGTTHSSLDPSLDPTPTTPTPEPDLEETPKTKTKTKKNTAQRKTAPRGKTTARKKRTTRTAKTKQET